MNDRRCFTRINIGGVASIHYDGTVAMGNIVNLSLQGMSLKMDQEIPFNIPVDVTVQYSAHGPITVRARVVRSEVDSVGVRIESSNINSFIQLRDLVSAHCNNQLKISQETYRMLQYLRM